MCAHPGSGTAEVAATSASITSLSTSRRTGAPGEPPRATFCPRRCFALRSHEFPGGGRNGPSTGYNAEPCPVRPRTDAPRRLEEHVTGAGANRHRIRDRRSRLLLSLLPAAVLLLLSGCTLQPASEQANGVKTLYEITFAFAAVIFVIVGGLIVGFAIRYRRKPGDDELPPQIHGNSTIEIVWTAIPTLIVLILFVLSAIELGRLDTAPASPKTMTIDVTGFQWQWRFTYPEFKTAHGNGLFVEGTSGQTKSLPVLHLAEGVPVHFHLESQDVIHSFFIPVFLFKRDVIPGHPNDFTMTPDRLGTFPGKCAELCGLYHSRMLFTVKIEPQDQFDAWAAGSNRCAGKEGEPVPHGAERRPDDRGPEHQVRHGLHADGGEPALQDRLRQQGRRHGAQRRDLHEFEPVPEPVPGNARHRREPGRRTVSIRCPQGRTTSTVTCTRHERHVQGAVGEEGKEPWPSSSAPPS